MQPIHKLTLSMMLCGSLTWLGCGSSGATADVGEAVQRDSRDAKQVLTDFLQLKRQANHAEADKLLSDKARTVINNVQLRLDPPVDDSVRTEIGEVKAVHESGAHVPTKWTQGEGENAVSLEIIWVMRNEPDGWRIVGAIGSFDPRSAEMVALDFEDEAQLRAAQAQSEPPPSQGMPQEQSKPPIEVAKQPQ